MALLYEMIDFLFRKQGLQYPIILNEVKRGHRAGLRPAHFFDSKQDAAVLHIDISVLTVSKHYGI